MILDPVVPASKRPAPRPSFHTDGTNSAVVRDMRGLAILLVTVVVLSAMVRGQPHFAPLPTGPMPAVNVP